MRWICFACTTHYRTLRDLMIRQETESENARKIYQMYMYKMVHWYHGVVISRCLLTRHTFVESYAKHINIPCALHLRKQLTSKANGTIWASLRRRLHFNMYVYHIMRQSVGAQSENVHTINARARAVSWRCQHHRPCVTCVYEPHDSSALILHKHTNVGRRRIECVCLWLRSCNVSVQQLSTAARCVVVVDHNTGVDDSESFLFIVYARFLNTFNCIMLCATMHWPCTCFGTWFILPTLTHSDFADCTIYM